MSWIDELIDDLRFGERVPQDTIQYLYRLMDNSTCNEEMKSQYEREMSGLRWGRAREILRHLEASQLNPVTELGRPGQRQIIEHIRKIMQ